MVGSGQCPRTKAIALFPSASFCGTVLVYLFMLCVSPEFGIPASGTESVSDFKLSWFEVPSVVISTSAMCVNQDLIKLVGTLQLPRKRIYLQNLLGL